jgi:manganese-dependent inorganic pyrophosphatase
VPLVYVTGHRNPDTDAISSAIGYAELKGRVDPANDYVPVRLGDPNAQTRWVLERSGAPEPDFLPHIMLRVCDVMQERFPTARHSEPIRHVGLTMAREDRDLVPILGDDGSLAGVMTERALARRYVRESREPTSLADAPARVGAMVQVLEGELVVGDDREVDGRVWVLAMDAGSLPDAIGGGDVVVVGDRPDAQRRAIELGVGVLITSNGIVPDDEVLALARERGATVVISPVDSYVSSRMVTLSAPCRALMDREPLTVRPDDLLTEVAELITDIDYRAAIAVDDATKCPVGLVTRSDLVNPAPRRVVLVDHAEQGQSVPGIDRAEIVEILDHHHVGSIETRIPVLATFDPVGSTATLVIERFRQNGMEPSRPTALMLLGGMLSDTVILNSPTTTDRDRAAVEYLGRALALDAEAFGREMFESTSDVSDVDAKTIVTRDAKEYQVPAGTLCIAQVETVGQTLLERTDELLAELKRRREEREYVLYALMVTDILAKGTQLLAAGDPGALERAFGRRPSEGTLDLPGVMSRKKQVAPRLLAAF